MSKFSATRPVSNGRSARRLVAQSVAALLIIGCAAVLAGTASAAARAHSAAVVATSGPAAAQDQYGSPFTPPSHNVAGTSQGSSSGPPASTSGTLPFTGLALLKVLLVGIGLLALGFLLMRGSAGRRSD
jgi:hypothetical protein